ncbi:MAG: 4Fe-4S double cluster binding domain-containing protein [Aristaeellaceae bacterium]
MNIVQRLLDAGFCRVLVLDGAECAVEAESVLLALWRYEAQPEPDDGGAWIHPYYFASQQAYEAASRIARECASDGAALRDDIRLKPIFARLPGLTQGRNTLSYAEGLGSRFHVQTMTLTPGIPPTHHLSEAAHELHCGNCHLCEQACPTNALEGGVFHRERCIRNWQMSGQPVPPDVREKMGGRLIGCDTCQRVCPHNAPVTASQQPGIPLKALLEQPKATAQALRPQIGVNLTIPNRVLSQACLMAGCSGDTSLLPLLEGLQAHPSLTVSEHAKWAVSRLALRIGKAAQN